MTPERQAGARDALLRAADMRARGLARDMADLKSLLHAAIRASADPVEIDRLSHYATWAGSVSRNLEITADALLKLAEKQT